MCNSKVPQPAPVAPAAAVASGVVMPAVASLGDWQASPQNGQFVLEGAVASQAAKDQLLGIASQVFGAGQIIDKLTVDAALPAFAANEAALGQLFGWMKNNASVTLHAAANRLTFAGGLGEAMIGGLADKIAGWFGDAVVLDTSGIEPQAMKAADALRQGATAFRIHVEFDTGKARLRQASRAELDELAAALKEANLSGEVAGYTDNVGDAARNQALSQQRAEAVKAYLNEQGVENLTAVGYGMEHPIASNDTAEGRQRNRRVQFHVR